MASSARPGDRFCELEVVGELWGYEDYELGDLWIPEEAGKGRSLKLPGGDDDDWEEGRGNY